MHNLRSRIFQSSHSRTIGTVALLGLTMLGIVLFIALTRVSLAEAPNLQGPVTPVTPAITITPTPGVFDYYSFAVKYVCGNHRAFENLEPSVRPGNYATDINIHNYQYVGGQDQQIFIAKKVLVLVQGEAAPGREPNAVGPKAWDSIFLGPDYATMDDCQRIWELLSEQAGIPIGTPIIGFMIFISTHNLDIDAVYTAQSVAESGAFPTGMSIDVERVPGTRITLPVAPSDLLVFLQDQ